MIVSPLSLGFVDLGVLGELVLGVLELLGELVLGVDELVWSLLDDELLDELELGVDEDDGEAAAFSRLSAGSDAAALPAPCTWAERDSLIGLTSPLEDSDDEPPAALPIRTATTKIATPARRARTILRWSIFTEADMSSWSRGCSWSSCSHYCGRT